MKNPTQSKLAEMSDEAVLAEAARRRAAKVAADDADAAVRAELDQREAAERAKANEPDLRPRTDEPKVMLTEVRHAIPGPGAVVFDDGALVDRDTDVPTAARNATVRGWLGGLVHPAAVKAQGVVCGGCGVTYRTEPQARKHWSFRHSAHAVERIEARRRRDEFDAVAQATPTNRGEDGAALAARLTGEWDAARREALHPRPWASGDPIDKDDIARRVQARRPGGDEAA